MSYDITLNDPVTKEPIQLDTPHQMRGGRLYLSCVCDGTLVFMEELKMRLRVFGCTDIQGYAETVKDADPPWMNCRFVAHGKVPDKCPEETEETYKNGKLRKYLLKRWEALYGEP